MKGIQSARECVKSCFHKAPLLCLPSSTSAWGQIQVIFTHRCPCQCRYRLQWLLFNGPSFQKLLAAPQRGALLVAPSISQLVSSLLQFCGMLSSLCNSSLGRIHLLWSLLPAPELAGHLVIVLHPNTVLPTLERNCLTQF